MIKYSNLFWNKFNNLFDMDTFTRSNNPTVLFLVIFISSMIFLVHFYTIRSEANLPSHSFKNPPFRFSNSCTCQSMFTIGICEEGDHGTEQLIPDWKSIKHKLKLLHEGEYIAGHEVYSSLSRHLKSGYKMDYLSDIPTFLTDAIDAQLPYVSCKQHFYSPMETLKCVKKFNQLFGRQLKLAFVGDSTLRLFIETFVREFDAAFKFHFADNPTHFDNLDEFLGNASNYQLPIEGQGLLVQFYWAPYLELRSFDVIERWVSNTSVIDFPDIVLISYGLWNGFYEHPIVAFDNHYSSLVNMTSLLSDLASKTNVFMKITPPNKQWLLHMENANIMNVLDIMNHMNFLKFSKLKIWMWDSLDPAIWKDIKECEYYATLKRLFNINTPKEWACSDINHYGIRPIQIGINILLNFICNKLMSFEKGSCCS